MEPTPKPHSIAVVTVFFALTATSWVVCCLASSLSDHAPPVTVEIPQFQNDDHFHRDPTADLKSLTRQAWRELQKGNTDHAIELFAAASKARPVPVILSARSIDTKSTTERNIEIHLKIGSGYEIYSERKHRFLLPLKTEVFDAKMRPIVCKLRYPKLTAVPVDNVLGEHFVYRGDVRIVASYAVDVRPAYVRVFYNGSYKGHT